MGEETTQVPKSPPDPAARGNIEKLPIINCHTHIFTGDHVPDYLGKSVIPFFFYKLLNFRWVFARFRWWYTKGPGKTKFGGRANEKTTRRYKRMMAIKRNPIANFLYNIGGWFLTLQAADIICHWVFSGPAEDKNGVLKFLYKLHGWLTDIHCLFEWKCIWLQLPVILVVIIFFKSGRNFLLFLLKNTVSIFKKLPGKQTKELFERYLTIGRFAFHEGQGSTLGQLERQYPEDSGFVILPMDMEYMDAGKVKVPYREQMKKLAGLKFATNDDGTLKHHLYPFVFVDPRRIEAEAKGTGQKYFDYAVSDTGEVILEDCFIKEYIEEKKFGGFKIYPALGYYPFDPLLLPLWKYAEQKQIPILTHCVRGPMYYRGSKKPAWDTHPVFKQTTTTGVNTPLLLRATKNEEFSANFTHPMNFLCLLEKEWLRKVVNQAYKKTKDERLVKIFGLAASEDDEKATISSGLSNLKICLGHYGGNDEWKRYFELDRSNHSNELVQNPFNGIEFLYLKNNLKDKTTPTLAPGKPEQLWKSTDWYSIISSMMLQHPNVYADISYILHNDTQILPLLKQTLQNQELRKKVLYGTDFYVVRNNKSDKNMLADMMGGLSEEDFDVIARKNPRKFLNLP